MVPQQEVRFSDFLTAENIVCGLASTEWEQAIGELADQLRRNEGAFDREAVVQACIERETASSTVIAPELAVPHARVEDLDRILVAIGTSPEGIPFAHEDRGLVHAIILILTPKGDPGLYLQALAALTKGLGPPGFRGSIGRVPIGAQSLPVLLGTRRRVAAVPQGAQPHGTPPGYVG